MQSKLCIVLLAIGLSQILALPSPSLEFNNPSNHLLQLLIQSRDINSDSTHSIECITYYNTVLNELFTTYESDFKVCLAESAEETAAIEDTTKQERDEINSSATSSCAALSACSEIETAEQFFKCYSEAGSSGTKTLFTISADASEQLALVEEQVRLIQVKEYACTNKTQREYTENSAGVYVELQLCIAGAPIPSETTSTQATSTESSTDSSSSDPESSTDSSSAATDSSTDSSSAEPESSTDSSSVATESSTDSSSAEPESSTDSSSVATESSTDSSSAEPESSTDSSSAATESSTDSSSAEPESSTDSSSVATESSTDSSSAEPESSTDSSSSATESSTDSSSVDPESSTAESQQAPEEDLKSISSKNSNDIQEMLKSLRQWMVTH
ncbi:suppressor protein SRP40 [Drosophila eugracilis]|uniref:suppressor protein SRP40 n=1 Tax=Drosophila eugracilis TaxID=29029 RepID=UPI0007E8ACF1|nr:suppressor protein SRP40 [Drosophila eugracilis]